MVYDMCQFLNMGGCLSVRSHHCIACSDSPCLSFKAKLTSKKAACTRCKHLLAFFVVTTSETLAATIPTRERKMKETYLVGGMNIQN